MSGGVDSSVAAALLQKKGYEVIGMTMCFNLVDRDRKKPACCGVQGIEDARRVCHALGVKHYVLNMQRALEKHVINEFCLEYLQGRTPNPCVRCNQWLKFNLLLAKALALDASYLATGHYARIGKLQASGSFPAAYTLRKGKDKAKDQSYFLYRLGQAQLKHLLFPLGNYTKQEVRELARKFQLPVAEKVASQEICFLPGVDYRGFLKERLGDRIGPGEVVDGSGCRLGEHKGIAFYTVGQREGLRIAAGYPLYITGIDASKNRLIVGRQDEVFKQRFLVNDVHYVGSPLKKTVVLRVRIRYNHKEMPAAIEPAARKLTIHFTKPQFAITPGQSAVIYDKDCLVGGGIIESVLQ